MTIARKNEKKFGSDALNIEELAVQKDQDYENERTWWIFEDGSALGLDSSHVVYVRNDYGLSVDHEQLR